MYKEKRRVHYSEVDREKNLSPVSVLNFFQDIATDHSAQVYPLDQMEGDHLAWLLISTRFRAERYPRCGEEVTVSTYPFSFTHSFSERAYEIYDENQNKIIEGSSLWILYNTEKRRPVRITDEVRARYTTKEGECLPVIRREMEFPESAESVAEFSAEMRDLDSNNHVNNVKYLEFASGVFAGKTVSEFEIFYRHEAKLHDALVLKKAECDGKTLCTISQKDGERCATMRFKFSGM